jgi:hypothetical protein
MRTHNTWYRSLLLALLLGLGVLAAASSHAATSCPAMQLFAVRGSGQTALDHGGYGEPLWTVYHYLKMKVLSMHGTPIDYPAIGFPDFLNKKKYMYSVNTGDVELYVLITKFAKSPCGQKTSIYLAGYSQGAQVVDDVLQMLSRSPSIKKRINGVVLFGDPRFNAKQSGGVDQGSFSRSLSGITRFQFPKPNGTFGTLVNDTTSETPLIQSYCAAGDPICNWSLPGARACFKTGTLLAGAPFIDCPHLNYDNLAFGRPKQFYVNAATAFLFGRKTNLIPAPPGRQSGGSGVIGVTHVGPLQMGRSSVRATIAFAGHPDRTWNGTSPAGTSIGGLVLGYSCQRNHYEGVVCATYYGFASQHLTAFRTSSVHFATQRGSRVGDSIPSVVRREDGVFSGNMVQCPGITIAGRPGYEINFTALALGRSYVVQFYIGAASADFSVCGS